MCSIPASKTGGWEPMETCASGDAAVAVEVGSSSSVYVTIGGEETSSDSGTVSGDEQVIGSNLLYSYAQGGDEYDVVSEVIVDYPVNGSTERSGSNSSTVEVDYNNDCDE